eukprot:scaffold13984_cov128-Skeletonema_dohrnii-CCMP3373.AAC.3
MREHHESTQNNPTPAEMSMVRGYLHLSPHAFRRRSPPSYTAVPNSVDYVLTNVLLIDYSKPNL